MQGARHGFIKWETGREGGREALCGVHVLLTLVYYFELFGTL